MNAAETTLPGGGRVLVGTSSWNDIAQFYPPGLPQPDRLGYYADLFPVVEVNTTYYRTPNRRMVEGWAERTPPGFVFDVKPPRGLTATPEEPRGEPPEPDADLAAAFAEALQPLRAAGKLGALTFQFPPSWRNTEAHRDYLQLLPELLPGFPIAVEFRRRDWLDPEHADATLALLRDAGLSYTMADEPQFGSGSVPPVFGVTNPRLAVVRFHGRNAATWYRFGGSSQDRFDWVYSSQELDEWTPRIETAAHEAAAVHVFFNTNKDDQGPRNAELLMRLLGLAAPTPPPF
ncbi:MAG: DUF72 domain-containing protein [Thermomicrobiales bacterium]|nr:DUF72 domain-containing protein [Thermomicrobiales bacterium]